MRICFVTEYFNPGGTGGTPSMIPVLARELNHGYDDVEIEVISSRNVYRGASTRLPSHEIWEGIQVYRVLSPPSNKPSTMARLAAGGVFTALATGKLLSRPRYDLVFVGTNPPMAPALARIVRSLKSTPYVYLIHDLYPDTASILGSGRLPGAAEALGRRFQRAWLHSSDRVIPIGRCMRDYLMTTYGLADAQISVITNWADPENIRELPRDTIFRRAHDLHGFVVLYSGNFGLYQDLDGIIDAAKLVAGQEKPITFVFVGDGAKRDHIIKRVHTEHITNVKLFPFVPEEEFADLLASADVSLVTLEPGMEGLGVPSKFYNILASGRPTVAILGQQSEVARVLDEHGCGVRVDQGDPSALADTITRLAGSPDDLATMGTNSRHVFERLFTIKAIASQYHEVFHQVVSGVKGTLK